MQGLTQPQWNLHRSLSAGGLIAHNTASSPSPSRMSSCSAFVSYPRPHAVFMKWRSSSGSREFDEALGTVKYAATQSENPQKEIASCSSSWLSKPVRAPRSYRAGRVVVCGLQAREGDFSALSSLSSPRRRWEEFGWGICGGSVGQKLGQNGHSRGSGRRETGVVTMALPIDAYWITAAEALAVAGLMGGLAALTGVFINIRIEVQALAEYQDLESKGLLPDEIVVPDGEWDLNSPLYIFQNKELSSAGTPRNRPVREEFQPQLDKELKTELVETASTE